MTDLSGMIARREELSRQIEVAQQEQAEDFNDRLSELEEAAAATVTVRMDADDFGRLYKDWVDRLHVPLTPGRFWAGPRREVNADWGWRRVHWFGEDYAAVLLACAYIATLGWEHEVLHVRLHGPDGDRAEAPAGGTFTVVRDGRTYTATVTLSGMASEGEG